MSARCQPPDVPGFMRDGPCQASPPPVWTAWDGGPDDPPQVLLPARTPEPPAKAAAHGGAGGNLATAIACAAAVYAFTRVSEPPAPPAAPPPLPPEMARMVERMRPTAEQMQRRWAIPASVLLSEAVLCAATNNWEVNGNDYFCRGRGYKSPWASFNAHAKALSQKLPGASCADADCFIRAALDRGLFLDGGERRLREMLPRVERAIQKEP